MFNKILDKMQFGRYVRERAQNTLVLYQQLKSPYGTDEEVYKSIIAGSLEMLIRIGYIDGSKQDTETYVEQLISHTKDLCIQHNKPFCLQAVASTMISAEAGFMAAGNPWANPGTIGRIVVRNVNSIISENI